MIDKKGLALMTSEDSMQKSQAQLRAIDSSVKQEHITGKDKSLTIKTNDGIHHTKELSNQEGAGSATQTGLEPEGKQQGVFGKILQKLVQKILTKEASTTEPEQEGKWEGIKVQGILATLDDMSNGKDKTKSIKDLEPSVMKEVCLIKDAVSKPISTEEATQASGLGAAKNRADERREETLGHDPASGS